MWQIAVYRSTQHDQFAVAARSVHLRLDATRERWEPVGAAEANGGLVLHVSAGGDALVIDCRECCNSIELADGCSFDCGVPVETPLPCVFRLADDWFEVRSDVADPASAGFEPLELPEEQAPWGPAGHACVPAGPGAATVKQWLAVAGQLHRLAANSPDYFDDAARMATEATGLDSVMVLTLRDGDWAIAGSYVPHPEEGVAFDAAAVLRLLDRQTVWRRTAPLRPTGLTTTDFQDAAVVAPIANVHGELIGALYGVRHCRQANRRRGIRTLEARVVQLMADAVAAGIQRRQQELESARQQVLLEQVFSPVVAEHLRRHPEVLAGAERTATMLFADLRGFTPIAEQLSPAVADELLSAVMEMLTRAIMDCQGVVIDYFGDGVSALWNAPLPTPNHADLACSAAMRMLAELPTVTESWRHVLPAPLELGIGIHTATVHVGNAGTRRRLKYGPRGHGANVASRVQSAAKHLNLAIVVTDAVRRQLSSSFVTLKVCTARLPGLDESLELFTVYPAADSQRIEANLVHYAAALDAFERGELDEAEKSLEYLLTSGQATPAEFLAQQTAALRQGALGRRATDQFACSPDAVIEILAK